MYDNVGMCDLLKYYHKLVWCGNNFGAQRCVKMFLEDLLVLTSGTLSQFQTTNRTAVCLASLASN